MREIKFRVWDKSINKMITQENVKEFLDKTIKRYEPSENRFDIMQYTGLHDKNGKEIYEGDIVRLGTYTKGVVEYSDEYVQFIIINTNTIEYEYEPLGDYTKIEIIGNKWDTSELLKNT